MKRKILSTIVCVALIMTLAFTSLVAADAELTLTCNDQAVSALELPKNETVALRAELNGEADGDYQWQILAGKDLWVNISGSDEAALTLRYGMVANLLKDNAADLRCRFTPADGEAIFSDALTVTVSEAQSKANANSDGSVTLLPEIIAPAADSAAASSDFFSRDLFAQNALDNNADSGARDSSDVKKTYNIVINYKFENNEIVADPYTANLAEGSSFSATVTFPTVQGYLPYIGETQQNSYTFNITGVSEDVTINVVYKPTNVNYTVIHYQQNVENDQYTEVARETKQGLTASQVPEVHKTYEGFYNLLYERPNIAADGSTVIEVYYDRYYYLMNFDMDGGYGTEPIYARYGAAIGEVNAPTKAGYNFLGWSETKGETDASNAVTLPKTMPAGNKTYHAIWQPDDTAKVTIIFWGENADGEGYSYLADNTKVVNLKPGSEFTYSEEGMIICDKEVHTHTDACLSCGKTEHTHSAVGGSCYTLTCTIDIHTHGTGCYDGVGSASVTGSFGKPNNPSEGQVYEGRAGTYIYIKGTWYDYTGSTASGSIAPTTCGKEESAHTHNNECYDLTCTTEEHTHGTVCYTCGKEAHTHNSDCYMQGAGLDSKLWKFVKSDTITVAADGSSVVNVYYDRTEFTLTFRDGNTTVKTLTEKWGADISEHWPVVGTNGTTYNNGERWTPSGSSTYRQVLVYLSIMPAESFTLTVSRVNYDTYYMHYMVEALPGTSDTTSYNGTNYVEKFSVTANYNYVTRAEDFFDLDGFTQKESNPSFNNGEIDIRDGGDVYFYYARNSYKLTFNDQYNDVKNETVKFEAPLSTYDEYVPEVPSAYEPGSVEFGGWYQNPQCTGEEYKLDEHKMPANDLILYAKWVPVTHTVTFYLDEDAYDNGSTLETHPAVTVPHGSLIDPVPAEPTKGSYTFVGWFYQDNGVEKAFDFANMQVRRDLDVYGKWSSNTLKDYTVQYVLKDDHSVKVADDLTGSGLAGTTKTFDAKGGTDLYAAYREGYFPTVQSQSLLLDIDEATLTITFEYVPMPAVPYTVCYVTDETVDEGTTTYGTVVVGGKTYTKLAEDYKNEDNRNAVVTETFKTIPGYMPDAYQKRLVVTADGENVLYFYYTQDTEHAYYKISHYIQNTDGTTWTEYASSQVSGDIGTRYTASPMTISGYTYTETEYVVNGTVVTDVTAEGATLTANGLEINLYYVPNEYPYQVRYLEQGSGTQLADPKNGTGKYTEVISESAIDIDGYDKVAPTSATLNIRIDEGEGAPALNIITFYYKEQEVTINYVPVGSGSVDRTTETVRLKSGTAQGSTPTPNEGYKFVGWYKDEACTQQVDASWVTDSKITPQKTDGKNVAATYYAKFEADRADLTITKAIVAGSVSTIDPDQVFVFKVVGSADDANTKDINLTVTVKGSGSVVVKDLPCGKYTVSEDTGWPWRYNLSGSTVDGTAQTPASPVSVDLNSVKTVIFTNTGNNDKWLSDEAYAKNLFTSDGIVDKNKPVTDND